MASTYTNIGTELMTTGENAGNWGTKTNTNIQILEEAVRGYTTQALTSGSFETLAYTDGSTGDVARNAVIKMTGTLSGTGTGLIVPNKEKVWIIENASSGAYPVTVKVSGQTGVTWALSDKGTKLLYCNGTDVIDTGITSAGAFDLDGKELILDADADTSITADTDDQIDIKIAGADDFTMTANAFNVLTGSHATFADSANAKFGTGNDMLVYHDGTNSYITNATGALKLATETSGIALTIGHTTSETTIADNLTVTGTLTGTLATAAQGSVTSLGTLTTLTVDNVITNGATIGHTSDTDLITLADGIVTVAGEISVTTLDIGGTNVTSDATELNLLDGKAATNLALLGKTEGTNFTDSLLVGHATTGTLSTAIQNTGVGIDALDAIATGDRNTAVGFATLTASTNGSYNTAIGNQAMTAQGSGGANTAIGSNSLQSNSTGSDNTALGYLALGNATEEKNTALGGNAGRLISTGLSNIAIGYNSGDNITSGDGNVIIGSINADSATGDKQLILADGVDGSVAWLKGDSSGNLTFPGALQVSGAVTVGVDDTGLDVKLFGATSGAYMLWDESTDDLVLAGAANLYLYDAAGGEKLSSDGTDLTINSGNDLNLTATTDINVPANVGITFGDDGEKIEGDGTNLTISSSGTTTIDSTGDIVLDGSNTTSFRAGGTEYLKIINNSSNAQLRNSGQDKDISFLGNDGGVTITALALDMSEAGAATFNNKVVATELDISGAMDIDGTANLDTVDIDGAVQIDAAFTSGVDGQGYDTKFFGDTSSAYMLWDTSADDLVFAGAAGIDLAGDIDVDGTANLDVVDIDGAVDMASTLAVAGVSSFAVAANVAQAAITSSSNAVAWDASAKPNAYHITTENTTLSAPSNAVEGAFICIEINFNGSHTFAWNAIFNFAADTAPTTTDTDAKTDILVFRYNGAIWQEVGRTLNIPES